MNDIIFHLIFYLNTDLKLSLSNRMTPIICFLSEIWKSMFKDDHRLANLPSSIQSFLIERVRIDAQGLKVIVVCDKCEWEEEREREREKDRHAYTQRRNWACRTSRDILDRTSLGLFFLFHLYFIVIWAFIFLIHYSIGSNICRSSGSSLLIQINNDCLSIEFPYRNESE